MVVVISAVKGDTRRYRTFHLYEQLRLAGIECHLFFFTDSCLHEKIPHAQIIILHRIPFDRNLARMIKTARRNNALVLADIDDLTYDPQAFQWIASLDFSDPIRRWAYIQDMERQRKTIEACDGVLCSTDFLADQVRLIGKQAWVHRNAFSFEMFEWSLKAKAMARRVEDRVVIGYASGTPTHDRDFAVVKPSLIKILDRHPKAELWMVGPVNPGDGFERFNDRVRRLPLVRWRDLPAVLRQFDINLAPLLTDNPFSQSKSEIKYMEAAMVGVATVASPTDAFCFAIEHGKNGFLASTSDDWFDALNLLIENPQMRHSVEENAYERAMNAYHPTVRSKELLILLDLINHQVKGSSWTNVLGVQIQQRMEDVENHAQLYLPEEIEKRPTNLERGLYSLKYRGLRVLLSEIWLFLRRILQPVFPFRSQ